MLNKELHIENARTAYHTTGKIQYKWGIGGTYYAACKVEYQIFDRSNSQLTYLINL